MIPIVERIPIYVLVFYFVLYLAIHIGIAFFREKTVKELINKPGNIDLEKKLKWINILFNWFPAIYVIFLVLVLMF